MKAKSLKNSIKISEIYNESQLEIVYDCVNVSNCSVNFKDMNTVAVVKGSNAQLSAFVKEWNK